MEGIGSREHTKFISNIFIQTESLSAKRGKKNHNPHRFEPHLKSCLSSFPRLRRLPSTHWGSFRCLPQPVSNPSPPPTSTSHNPCANLWSVGCYKLPFAPSCRLLLSPPPSLGMRQIRRCNDMLS